MLSTEPVELVESCIICYDSEDEHGNMPVRSSDFLQTKQCSCEYMIHATCMRQWLATCSAGFPHHHQLRCLVCSSIVEKKQTMGEKLLEHCRLSPAVKRELCRYILYGGGVALFGLIVFGN